MTRLTLLILILLAFLLPILVGYLMCTAGASWGTHDVLVFALAMLGETVIGVALGHVSASLDV